MNSPKNIFTNYQTFIMFLIKENIFAIIYCSGKLIILVAFRKDNDDGVQIAHVGKFSYFRSISFPH